MEVLPLFFFFSFILIRLQILFFSCKIVKDDDDKNDQETDTKKWVCGGETFVC